MPSFPTLRTGAAVQFPYERQLRFSTQVFEFLDGREQRFRDYARGLRRWVIRLDLLTPDELTAIATFFDEAAAASSFSFTDPSNGSVYANCSLDGPDIGLEMQDESSGRTELIIRENG